MTRTTLFLPALCFALLSAAVPGPLLAEELEARNDSYQVQEDSGARLVGDVLVNDSAPARLRLLEHTLPDDGTLVDNGDGTFDFTPDADFFGAATFEYTVGAESRMSSPSGALGFGRSVAIDEDYAVVGAPDPSYPLRNKPGRAYIYFRDGDRWVQEAMLTEGSGANSFGGDVAISGDTVVVAAPIAGGWRGKAYVYVRSGAAWTRQATLVPSVNLNSQLFGMSVAIDDDTIVVGSIEDHPFNSGKGTGRAYVFVRSGSTWSEQQRLVDPAGHRGDWFGLSVAIQGDVIAVGAGAASWAPPEGGISTWRGKAFVFVRSGGSWTRSVTLVASDNAGLQRFGSEVSLWLPGGVPGAGTTVAVKGRGDASGKAYVYVWNGSAWVEEVRFPGKYSDIAVRGDELLLGRAHVAGETGAEGEVRRHIRGGDSWPFTTLKPLSTACGGCRFGHSLDWRDDETIIVGTNSTTSSGGKAFVRSIASSTATVRVEVLSVNDAPGFVGGPDATSSEDAGPQEDAGWASSLSTGPANESDQTLTFEEASNSRPDLFAAGPAVDPGSGDLTYTPAADANGVAAITLRARDDGGTNRGGLDTSDIHSFEISISPINDAPSFVGGPSVSRLNDGGAPIVVPAWASNISSGPSDESAQILSFDVQTTNPGLFAVAPAIDPVSGSLSFTPAAGLNGVAPVVAVLRDNGGTADGGVDASAGHPFSISLTLPPTALCLSVGVDADAELCRANASIDNGSFDPDGGGVTLSQDPAGPFAPGDTLVTLSVDDGEAVSSCQATVSVFDVTYPIAECGAPVAIGVRDVPISFQATGSDTCGPVTMEIENAACYRTLRNGSRVPDRSCSLSSDGDTLTVLRAGGVGTAVEWQAVATDESGNETRRNCRVSVDRPAPGP